MSRRTGAILSILCLTAACGKLSGRQPVVFWSVENRVRPPFSEDELKRLAQTSLKKAVSGGRLFSFARGEDHGAWRAEIRLNAFYQPTAEEDETAPGRRLELELVFWRKQADGDRVRLSAVASAEEEKAAEEEAEAFRALWARALCRAIELIEIELEAQKLSEQELARLLDSRNDDIRLQALKALRARRLESLQQRVVRLLREGNTEIVLEAVGVLVAWKAQSAAVDLIRSATGKNVSYQVQLLSALGEIGGPVARGYLFTVAAGHASENLRRLAEENLQRVLRAEGADARPRGEETHD